MKNPPERVDFSCYNIRMNHENFSSASQNSGANIMSSAEIDRSRNKNIGHKVSEAIKGLKNIGHKTMEAVKSVFSGEKTPSDEYLLSEHVPDAKTSKFMKRLCKEWDEYEVKMPREMGESLEAFVNDPDIWFGIHRSSSIDGAEFENDKTLQKIMQEGLINLGDASSGAIRKDPEVGKTVKNCRNMLNTVIHMKTPYKGSTGAVLVAIPKKYLRDDRPGSPNDEGYIKPGCENLVYDHDADGYSSIKPEFLMGFVQNLGKGHTLEFKTRDEILAAANKNQKQ